ncbi:hypothetical protein ZOSMA_181G00350 [Zostera marina]|uniref:TF-B3 domain-containing protein n=1 Tax=Zostera marina TaxID=29655 RepID=A0A0K9PT29_ZOSMR|nr:hypothetical protein ZOSMA_181G00350 [Zostera marina]
MDKSTTSNNPPDPLDCNTFLPPPVPQPFANIDGFGADHTIYQHQRQYQVEQPNVYLYPNISMENVAGVDPQYYYNNSNISNNGVMWPLNNRILDESRTRMQQQEQQRQEHQLEQLQRQIEKLQKLQKEQDQLHSSGTSYHALFPMTQPNSSIGITLQFSPYTQDFSLFPSLVHLGYKFLFQKELKNSDVSNLGRIILPKRESEGNLPYLMVKDGIYLNIKELFNTTVWRMKYRFWPNNKSRMYVLENTGEFVKVNELKSGDFISFYQDINSQLYICCRNVDKLLQETRSVPTANAGNRSSS